MIVISYDIQNDKLRNHFSKMLSRYGAIRLQYSVYEVNNTKRVIDNIIVKIENLYAKEFSGADSVIIFLADNDKLIKYGNAIHRDTDVVYF
jgi:CRISPR-associated protein Cas2